MEGVSGQLKGAEMTLSDMECATASGLVGASEIWLARALALGLGCCLVLKSEMAMVENSVRK